MRIRAELILLVLAVAVLAAGCQRAHPPVAEPLGGEQTLAVAAFSNPRYNWETLSGALPAVNSEVDSEVLANLDKTLSAELSARERSFIPHSVVRRCQEIVTRETSERQGRAATFEYWLQVGACVPADYLLVPQVIDFSKREGGDWGVSKPASVTMQFYLLDVKNDGMAGRYTFEETQQALSEDLLSAPKFLERGGKWITADTLAGEGIRQAVAELGL